MGSRELGDELDSQVAPGRATPSINYLLGENHGGLNNKHDI